MMDSFGIQAQRKVDEIIVIILNSSKLEVMTNEGFLQYHATRKSFQNVSFGLSAGVNRIWQADNPLGAAGIPV